MRRARLGRTDIEVPILCLGTMTYGTQTSQADAHAQIDQALDAGLNFLDTAEMYPVNPVSAETQGDSERTIGSWIARSGRRADVTIATKHSGNGWAHIRNRDGISAASIPGAIDASLTRLQTDYIDLYQFHWPNRGSYAFRQNWDFRPQEKQNTEDTLQHMADALGALQRVVDAGKIRAFGLSNESAWGTAQWLRLAETEGGPRVASVQNEYSLLHRLYDTDMAELSHHEDVGLLAFSPLAAGLLTGKYQDGAVPEGSRKSLVPELGGRATPRAFDAVAAYEKLALKHGLSLTQMAVSWCCQRPFMGAAIIGATHLPQLGPLIEAGDMTLSDEVLTGINAIHRQHPLPY
ncbi:MAG: aldo/keto reductase [Pseudomonadota bacterium]